MTPLPSMSAEYPARRAHVPPSQGWWRATLVLLVISATIVGLLRQAGSPSWRTLWAEDGEVFLNGALQRPAWATLLESYAGYAHALPRLLAGATTALVPDAFFAVAAAVSSAVVVGLLCAYVAVAGAGGGGGRGRALLLAFAIVVMPVALAENTANWANLQWVLAFATFFALADDAPTKARRVVQILLVTLAPLSAPLVVVYVPYATRRLHRARAGCQRVVGLCFLAATGTQVVVAAASPDPDPAFDVGLGLAQGFAHRVITELAIGPKSFSGAYEALGAWLPVSAVVVAALMLVLAGLAAPPPAQRRATLLVALSLGTWLVSDVARSIPTSTRDVVELGSSRYALTPQLFLVAAIVVVVTTSTAICAAAVIASLWGVFVVAPNLREINSRSSGPEWPEELEAAACDAGIRHVTIAPPGGLWSVQVPCNYAAVPPGP